MGRRVVTRVRRGLARAAVWVIAPAVTCVSGIHPAAATDPFGATDLRVGIVTAPKVAQPGQPLIYRVGVRNAGPGDAVLPVLTVQMPRDFHIFNVNVAECRPGPVYNQIVCKSGADVLSGGVGGMTVTGIVRPGAKGPLRATATLTSEIVDLDEADNKSESLIQVDGGADLAVQLTPSTRSTQPGHWFTLDALVRNRGPRIVTDAYLFFQPSRARFVSAQGARCDAGHGFIGCALPPIRSGHIGRLRLMLRVPPRASRPVGTSATVYSRRFGDRRPANNQAHMRIALRRG